MSTDHHFTIPILKLRNCYLVTLATELSDVDALDLQDRIMNHIWKDPADAVIVDITALDIVDSFISRVFNDIGTAARTMGALALIVGMNPAIAITLVEMDIEMDKVLVMRDVDSALVYVEEAIKKKSARRIKMDGNKKSFKKPLLNLKALPDFIKKIDRSSINRVQIMKNK